MYDTEGAFGPLVHAEMSARFHSHLFMLRVTTQLTNCERYVFEMCRYLHVRDRCVGVTRDLSQEDSTALSFHCFFVCSIMTHTNTQDYDM